MNARPNEPARHEDAGADIDADIDVEEVAEDALEYFSGEEGEGSATNDSDAPAPG